MLNMRSATVRELKNKTSDVLRRARREDIVITSRGRPVACLIGLQESDLEVRPKARVGYADPGYRRRAFQALARIWKMKPDKGKHWTTQEHHDAILYGESNE